MYYFIYENNYNINHMILYIYYINKINILMTKNYQ